MNMENQEQLQLEAQLKEAVAAENFFDTASGKLATEIMTKRIAQLVRDITSDKFLKDHIGYVNALSELKANRHLLKSLQVGASPSRRQKIKERLEMYG